MTSRFKRGARSTTTPPATADPEFPIPTGQTNAALGANGAAVIATVALLFDPFDLVEKALGPTAAPADRAVMIVGVLAAWALVSGADLLARAYAAAHESKPTPPSTDGRGNSSKPNTNGTGPHSGPTAPDRGRVTGRDFTVTYLEGPDSHGWQLYSVTGDHAVIYKPGEPIKRVELTSLLAATT